MKISNHLGYHLEHNGLLFWQTLYKMRPSLADLRQDGDMDALLKEYADDGDMVESIILWDKMTPNNQSKYYITTSVVNSLDKINVKQIENEAGYNQHNWKFFTHLPKQKNIFMFHSGEVLKMEIDGDTLWLCYFWKENGGLNWVEFDICLGDGELLQNHDSLPEENFIYKFLCFMFLSEHEFKIMKPNDKDGNRKNGKTINDTDSSITIVNSSWNITSIRTEGFGVRGHFAIRLTGEGRMIPRLVYIEPYEKNGYIRKAKKDVVANKIAFGEPIITNLL